MPTQCPFKWGSLKIELPALFYGTVGGANEVLTILRVLFTRFFQSCYFSMLQCLLTKIKILIREQQQAFNPRPA